MCACGSNASSGATTEENKIQSPITIQESQTAETKAAIDFTQMESKEAYDSMVKFMEDPTLVVGTPIKLRGKVTSTEFTGGKKWYSVELTGEGGYQSGPHFLIEGLKEEDYPDTMTIVEISGIYELQEGVEDPSIDDYYVMVKPENYINVNEALAEAVVVPDKPVYATDTMVFDVNGVALTYMGKDGNDIMFHAENDSDKKVTLNSIEVMFNGITVTDSFWISLKAGETTDTDITAYPITLEEAGIAKLETVSFQVEMIDEDDAVVKSGVIIIKLQK